MIDWSDPKRTDVLHFQMVDPNNLDATYGDIEDVQLGSTTITYGYYTDTRYSSGITFLEDNNYIPNSWIRIIHEVPAEGYVNELGTFIPVSPNVNYNGAVTKSLDLQSPLWGISNDLCTTAFAIGKGANLVSAFQRACKTANRPYLMADPNGYHAGKTIVYEAGTSYLEILMDIANASNNHVDIDGHGRIILEPQTDKQSLSPLWELNADDSESMIIDGSIRMEPEPNEIPNRTLVIDNSYIGYADLADGDEYSAAQRGYIKAEKYSGSGLSSNAQALNMARSYLRGFSKITQWTMETMYFPAHCGDTVQFTLENEKHLCMIQSIDPLNLETMTMTLTLREVVNG